MNQGRLSVVSMLSIKNEFAENMNYDEVLDTLFIKKKTREGVVKCIGTS